MTRCRCYEIFLSALLPAYLLTDATAYRDSSHEKRSDGLVKSLRKKLMENNYDYSSEKSNDVHKRAESVEYISTPAGQAHRGEIERSGNKQDKMLLLARDNVSAKADSDMSYDLVEGSDALGISKNDLLYYIDDRHLTKSETKPVKYKILKTKHKSRRRGLDQLIQEEGEEGIAIVNLGGGPFPEFRLPKSRRQYMHDHGVISSGEDELQPPSVNDPTVPSVLTNPYKNSGLNETIIREMAAVAPEGERAGGTGDLVEVIKVNLRKNNDDYSDAPNIQSTSDIIFKSTTFPTYKERSKNKIKKNIKGVRRANADGFHSEIMDDNLLYELESNVVTINKTDAIQKNNLRENEKITPINTDPKLNKISINSQPQITTQMRVFTKSNRSKIEKFQKYFEKNKALFKEFLSSKIAARTQTRNTINKVQLKGKGIGRGGQALIRGQDWLDNDESETTAQPEPDPDHLDMLPAVGGRIHYRRIKGRLCHRHVLMPEGPKYDSKGRVYLPAHEDKAPRPYNVTRRPKLLLPKCCNCCKKSVLGCE